MKLTAWLSSVPMRALIRFLLILFCVLFLVACMLLVAWRLESVLLWVDGLIRQLSMHHAIAIFVLYLFTQTAFSLRHSFSCKKEMTAFRKELEAASQERAALRKELEAARQDRLAMHETIIQLREQVAALNGEVQAMSRGVMIVRDVSGG